MPERIEHQAPADPTARIRHWLAGQRDICPPECDRQTWEYAYRYTTERYQIGLEHYRNVFRQLGWSGRRRRGLDVGSGVGNWAIAFALDNPCARATGIDINAAFVHLANGAAKEAGLADRVQFHLGRAAALDFPDCHFDAAWAHSVLMYIDIEEAIAEIARVLAPGGQFYYAYSGIGLRLNGIYQAVSTCQPDILQIELKIYLGAMLQRRGLNHTPSSQVCSATAEELAALCEVCGFIPIGRPGLQDGPRDFAGIPSTFDMLCVRDDGDGRRAALRELSAATESGRRRYHELVRLGLGRLVRDVLVERGEDLNDSDIRSLYVLACVRAGRADEAAAIAQDRGIDDLLIRGLLAFELRRAAEALDALGSLPADHPERSFLLGMTLFYAGQPEIAAVEFERGAEAGHCPVECELGAMLARSGVADWPEMRLRLGRVLRLLPAALGASPEKIDHLVERLPAPSPADHARLISENMRVHGELATMSRANQEVARKLEAADRVSRTAEALKQEVIGLRYKARRWDEVKDQLPSWQAKAKRWDQLVQQKRGAAFVVLWRVLRLMPGVGISAEIAPASVRTLKKEKEVAQSKRANLAIPRKLESADRVSQSAETLKQEVIELRHKAQRYDEIEDQLPSWRAKAQRWDQVRQHKRRGTVLAALRRGLRLWQR